MKIAKVSLAALVALSALATTASATPLEEAIKDVDFSGFARYRYTNDKVKSSTKKVEKLTAGHRFRFEGNFKSTFDDNFFGVLGLRYDTLDGSGKANDETNTTASFGVKQFYLGLKLGNTTIQAGKQNLNTFFDGDLTGTGLAVYNKDIDGLTVAAFAYDALQVKENGSSASDKNGADYDGKLIPALTSLGVNTNLYGLGLSGSFDPVAFQLWLAHMPNTATMLGTELKLNAPVADDVKLGVQAQYAGSFVSGDVEKETEYKDAHFYAAKANADFFGANLNAGYINFKAKEHGKGFVTLEDNGKLINPAKVLNSVMSGSSQYYNNIKDKNHFWFVGAGYTFDKFNIAAAYVAGKGYSYGLGAEKAKRKEANVSASYAYSKKLKFSGFYAAAKDKKDGETYKQNRIRFETKYSF